MHHKPFLSTTGRVAADVDAQDMMQTRIRNLLQDPAIAERVRKRLHRAGSEQTSTVLDSLAPRAARRRDESGGRSRIMSFLEDTDGGVAPCRSLQCLCGRFPSRVSPLRSPNAAFLRKFAW